MQIVRFFVVTLIICLFNLVWFINLVVYSQEVFVSNLSNKCLRCLCYAASNCDLARGCSGGFCGPYQLGYSYWKDAGSPTLSRNDRNSITAFQNCALTFPCAQGTIREYMARYGQDCNNDGITDCDDFAMINFNGAFQCDQPLSTTAEGRTFWLRYTRCRN
ncbi:hypothetical protein FQA39_LY05008 [Lamprigera yunnana]|nr:hypothetical protein FQA39_LY05008 [Lamprigera yunnana]